MNGFCGTCDQFESFSHAELVLCRIAAWWESVDELHCKVRLSTKTRVGCPRFVDLRDAWMLEPAEGLRFLFKAEDRFGTGHAGLNDLQCNGPAWMLLFRFIDDTHAAFPDHPENSVSSDRDRVPGAVAFGWHLCV